MSLGIKNYVHIVNIEKEICDDNLADDVRDGRNDALVKS